LNASELASLRPRLWTAGLVLGGTLLSAAAYGGWPGSGARALSAEEARDTEVARSLSAAYRRVAREIDPAVVSIEAVRRSRAHPAVARGGESLRLPDGRLIPFEGELFGRFFGSQGFQLPEQRGQGTGVIVSQDGTIVTNAHVVAGADEFRVTLHDGRELPATLVGVDRETDVAALRVEAEGLRAARFGDSGALEPGDLVVAVGTPYGLAHSVTAGIVSAIGRHDVGVAVFEDLIQTDAAINPGNSGGPLLNLDGEVIGINTAIRTRSGGSDGISFAIPSRTVERVLAELKDGGRVERGWLGASIQDLDPDLARSFGFEGERGALVAGVLPESPAQRGGLRAGDIVTRVDRTPIASSKALRDTIASLRPGREVDLELWREGEARTLSIDLGTRPTDEVAADAPSARDETFRWGLALEDLDAEQARALGAEGARGALIAQVEPASPAARAGLRPGQVITSVDGREVDSAEACARALRAASGDAPLRLHVRDGDAERFVLLRPQSTSAR
jgi:serine protease Do